MAHKLTLLIILVMLSFLLVAAVSPEEGSCPTAVQMGEIDLLIPAGGTVGSTLIQITRCPGMNVQVSGGSMLQTPVVINGIVHHDVLILTVYLQDQQPDPIDITIWWRVD